MDHSAAGESRRGFENREGIVEREAVMNMPLSCLSCLVAFLLVAACDGGSYKSATAPPAVPPPAPTGGPAPFVGSISILGVESSDPADECIARSLRRSAGRAWPISIGLGTPIGGSFRGAMATPLLPVAQCSFDFPEIGKYDFSSCRFSSSAWELGRDCSHARDLELTGLAFTANLYCEVGELCFPGNGGVERITLTFESNRRSLEVLAEIDLR